MIKPQIGGALYKKIYKSKNKIKIKGALLYEMLSGAPPFYSKDKNQMLRNRLEVMSIIINIINFLYE